MTAIPAVRAARGGLSGRRVQAIVIGAVVLVSTAASTLALSMLTDSNAPFDHAFARQHGAHVAATVTGATAAELGATSHLTGVTAAAGPFPETSVTVKAQITPQPPGGGPGPGGSITVTQQLDLIGRSAPGGPVDDLVLTQGHWATGPGQVVWDGNSQGAEFGAGSRLTVDGTGQRLTVVGVANSITGTAQAWVTPSEIAALERRGAPAADQMLYRFASAGSTAQVNADVSEIRSALPRGDLAGAQSYLTAKLQAASGIAPWVPFIVAFGLIGLVMSVLIVANVVSGAVVAGTQRIGVLKSIGFSPAQVVAAYVLQVAAPALIGCLAGVAGGNLLAKPLLGQQAQVYGVGRLGVPFWVDVAVPLAMLGLSVLAAVALATRAGRMSATAAIATGRAPRPRHGYLAHRLLGRLSGLPRPVTIGLASPFARPARTAVTLVAVLAGAVTVTFAIGLATSLGMVFASLSHSAAEPVQIPFTGVSSGPGGGTRITISAGAAPSLAAQEHAAQAALHAQPGTAHYTAESDAQISVLGLSQPLSVIGFTGDASWTGYAMISGHWYSGPRQVDVNTAFLTATGSSVGNVYTLTSAGRHTTVTIAGEVFDPQGGTAEMFGARSTFTPVDPRLEPDQYDVSLKPGTSLSAYVNALSNAGLTSPVVANTAGDSNFAIIIGLITTMTLLLAAVAALGVLNTVVLQTRERVHDLGVFKAVGMTPRQTIAMVVCSASGVGLLAGVIAVPLGVALHHYVLPVMGNAAQTGVPAVFLNVYHPAELVLLALAGLAIAVIGALAPAGWAAGTRTATALRAE
ncbi:MAG TPA: FtsX-like permease family protein [Streptosporangiaceae bacterium]|nr:FtsX-like permease family protein [Streptosporangiaceae bacterium]